MRLNAAVAREGFLYVDCCLEVEVAWQDCSFEAMANLTEALELFFEDHPQTPQTRPIIAPIECRPDACV